MYFDRYDIIEAHYWFCTDYHGGQGTREYRRLSRISRYYRPDASQCSPGTENGQAIYEALALAAWGED